MTTRRLHAARVVAVVGLATVAIASCGIDESGLGSMPFLPHDASAGDAAGVAGTTGKAGTAGTGSGAAGVGGTAGTSATGIAGAGGTAGAGGPAGAGGTDSGVAGSGVAGSGAAGSGGAGGGDAGTGGSSNAGDAGAGGDAGTGGIAGTGGTAGAGGTAGIGGTAGGGVAGSGGRGGIGGLGGTVGGRGGGVVTPCNATTCSDGCCKDSTTCIRMRSAMQCGMQGAACAPCGGCHICSSTGQCRIDSASRWKIIAVSAKLDSGPWDRANGDVGGGQPDPFCEYENPAGQVSTSTAGVTDTLVDTREPMWNQEINPPGMTVAASTLMATNPTWQIWVGDDDGCNGPGGCLGDTACTIRQTITEAQLRAGQLVVNNRQSCDQVTIGFVCQPLFP